MQGDAPHLCDTSPRHHLVTTTGTVLPLLLCEAWRRRGAGMGGFAELWPLTIQLMKYLLQEESISIGKLAACPRILLCWQVESDRLL